MSDFWQAQIMKAEDIKELSGQDVDPNLLSVHPTGNLLHVLVELPPDTYGRIQLPESEMGKEKMGIGYIIAAGPRAGHHDYASAISGAVGVIGWGGSDTFENSDCLLGLHVIFGAHTGMPIRVSMLDREFASSVMVMSAKDIRGVDTNPIPLTKRVKERTQ